MSAASMIIECPYCKSRVVSVIEGHAIKKPDHEDPTEERIAVGKCPMCSSILVGKQEEIEHPDFGATWSDSERLWPRPQTQIPWQVPPVVRFSLEEAERCYMAGAFSACAVMCGRAIEGVCIHHKTKNNMLAKGLKELLDKEIIDKRLYQWGEELRKLRNLGAHATDEKVPPQDASDVLAFAKAITEYVFVLTTQFNEFMERRPKPN